MSGLRTDTGEQLGPRLDERLRILALEIIGELVIVDACPGELGKCRSAFPPSTGINLSNVPWSANASSVASGIVLMVNGAASALTYRLPYTGLDRPGFKVLFCGINPGLYSAAANHHFARLGNRLWPALYLAGFLATKLLGRGNGNLSLQLRRPQQSYRNQHCRHEESQRSNDPHDHSPEHLIVKGKHMERVRVIDIELVDRSATKRKKC